MLASSAPSWLLLPLLLSTGVDAWAAGVTRAAMVAAGARSLLPNFGGATSHGTRSHGYGSVQMLADTPHPCRARSLSPTSRRVCSSPVCLSGAVSTQTLLRQSEVMEVLSEVEDPALLDHTDPEGGSDVVSRGLVRAVVITDDSVNVRIEMPTEAASAGAGERVRSSCEKLLREGLDWISDLELEIVRQPAAPASSDMSPLQQLASSEGLNERQASASSSTEGTETALPPGVANVAHIVAVASCKGGVGKSTTAVNMAFSLAAQGHRVGIVDLDVHGPSLPTMVSVSERLQIDGEALLPHEVGGVKLMSMGFINPGVMPLRGAKVTPVVQQLVGRTAWGALDYLIVDMPPGTGDVQLTLSQDFSVSAAVLVTTPQRLSFVDVVKGVEMFDKVGIPTIAVVENMCGLQLDGVSAELESIIESHGINEEGAEQLRALLLKPQQIFGDSHVQRLQEMWGISASFSLPLLPELAKSTDVGTPAVLADPDGQAAKIYSEIAAAVDAEVRALKETQKPALLYVSEENTVYVGLANGEQQKISPIELRRLCRSPSNNPDNLPADLKPLDFVPMGNYAISVRWSDGHQSLLPYRSFLSNWP